MNDSLKAGCNLQTGCNHVTVYALQLKEHDALDRSTWSFKSVCNRLFRMHGWKDVLKVEYNDPHKHVSIMHGFSF